jgi:carbonic anhydrase
MWQELFMRNCALIIAFLIGSGCAMAQSTNWDYAGRTGPLAWGRLDPAYQACSKGHEQSPIDIHGARLNKKLQPIEFHYIAASVELENTGNLIVARVKP